MNSASNHHLTLTKEEIDTIALTSQQGVLVKDDLFEEEREDILIDCLKLVDLSNSDPSLLKQARYGKENIENSSIRGDYTTWLTPEFCKQHQLTNISKVISRMIQLLRPLKSIFKLNSDYSVQFALYPGNGSRYIKHIDSSPRTDDSKSAKRKLTMLFYLNKEFNGGNLRIYPNNGKEIEIEPKFGRIVLFRSDIEHEVLPSYSNRLAITLWAYGDAIPAQLPQSIIPAVNSPIIVNAPLSEYQQSTIFVGIAAYRDSETKNTINDLLRNAANPQRIFIGVLWQHDSQSDGDCVKPSDCQCFTESEFYQHVRILKIDATQSQGPCWARHIVGSLWQGEQYYLQTDSHMRFRYNWDTFLIKELEEARGLSEFRKPVLTTYPQSYKLPNAISSDNRPTILAPLRFDDDGLLRQSAKILTQELHSPIPSPLWAAGFSFADSSMISEVRYDPMLPYLFFGEEISMAARLYTHGYDFYAPSTNVCYHLWQRSYRPVFQENIDHKREILKRKSINRVLSLLRPSPQESSVDFYGLGNKRTIQAFEDTIGVSFTNQLVFNDRINIININGEAVAIDEHGELKTEELEKLFSSSNLKDTKLQQIASIMQKYLLNS